MANVRRWLEERIPVDPDSLRHMTNEPVPNHMKKWWFALGGTPAYLFVVQIVTGILVASYYDPSPAGAYESVRYITNDANFGWFIRGIHKWGATLMIAAVVLHQMRVFFTGAYRKPREINWMVGMTILICVLLTGFTGYSLVYEQLSYWGATVGANITDSVPVIGGFLRKMLLAGEAYNPRTLPRFFILHAAVLPVTLTMLLVVHIAIIRIQGVSELRFEGEDPNEKKHFDFFPDHMMTELGVGLVLMVLLAVLATILPPELGPKADPLVTPEVIKPEWFFYVAFRWLKLMSATAAILSMGLVIFLMFLWPFIDAWIRRNTRFSELSVWIGVLAMLAITGMTVWEAVVAH